MRRSTAAVFSSAALAVALALAGCGVGPDAPSPELSAAGTSTTSSAAGVDADAARQEATKTESTLFSDGTSHTVSIIWNEDDYAAMIAAYEADGSKEWIAADISIDGTTVTNIGVRLKGNSTLRSLSGDGGMGGPGGTSTGISSDVPESLPLLIRFDKYVDGQTYQGLGEVSLRPGSPVLNEALALALTKASGQATQRYAYTTYSVNGSATQTRLLVENPDEDYADSLFDTDGVLYKADAESSFTYQGNDLATYEDQFKQLNNEDTETVQPIVDFLKWLSEASDEEFDAGLAGWVDVESFARYTATMNLLVNGDDMAGPGQNYYLWYDLDTKKISVISWDLNLAMTGNAAASPDEQVSIGGGGGGGGMRPPGQDDGGWTPFAGATAEAARDNPGGTNPGGGRGGNELKERFLDSDAFQTVYDAVYADFYAQLYTSGTAAGLLDSIAAVVPDSDDLSQEEIERETEDLRRFITERTEALKSKV